MKSVLLVHNKVFPVSKEDIIVILDNDKKSGRMKGLLWACTEFVKHIIATLEEMLRSMHENKQNDRLSFLTS